MKSEKEITQDLMREHQRQMLTASPEPSNKPRKCLNGPGLWVKPFHSEALGVNPDQIPEATEALRRAGCMADFDADGRCIVTSNTQYQQVAKACGLKTGRDGFGGGMDSDGNRIRTGREDEQGKQAFRDAVARGEYDHLG